MESNVQATMDLPNWKPSEELCEPISKNWRTFDANLSLTKTFGEYIILV